jgi:hypothetical protein
MPVNENFRQEGEGSEPSQPRPPQGNPLSEADEKRILATATDFLADRTRDGLFPLVAFSSYRDSLTIVTTSIEDFPYAIRILERINQAGYNLGFSLRPGVIRRLANENPHVFQLFELSIPRISELDTWRIGRIVCTFGAPFYSQKGFALLDICGFSRLDNPSKLAQLYSLTNAVDSSIHRSFKACQRLRLPNRFGRTSTGDGFYLWHDFVGGNADVATFFLLVCIMTQSEAMRSNGFPMRLRASFTIDSVFMLYEADARSNPMAPASNAVGDATNNGARLITAAKPSQILLGDFARPGQPGETMTPQALLAQINELFREEWSGAATLDLQPKGQLRVDDKHGDSHYCWNIVGQVPNGPEGDTTRVTIGLHPDKAAPITSVDFVH